MNLKNYATILNFLKNYLNFSTEKENYIETQFLFYILEPQTPFKVFVMVASALA